VTEFISFLGSRANRNLEILHAPKQERSTFSRDQIRQLFKAANPEWKGMILFGACHGLRLGDCSKLTWAKAVDSKRDRSDLNNS
jgi:integrase